MIIRYGELVMVSNDMENKSSEAMQIGFGGCYGESRGCVMEPDGGRISPAVV